MRNLMLAEAIQVSGGNDTIITVNVKAHVSTGDGSFVADQLGQLIAREGKDPVSTFDALTRHSWTAGSEIVFLSVLAPCAFTVSFL